MDRTTTTADAADAAGWTLPNWAWMLGAVALFFWQGWLTLGLFGPEPWDDLVNDRPIVSGVHPQNLYLGEIGVHGIHALGRTTVYDPNFQEGYPKTPIFDGGRLAELFMLMAPPSPPSQMGGGAAAYKIGFASLCLLVPLFLLLAGKTLGLGNGTTLLATFLGQLIWWGPLGRTAIATADCELYLASLASLAHIGLLVSYDRTANVPAWFGIWLTAGLGWFLQPLLFPLALPVILIYYLSVGAKHELLTWHAAFWAAQILAVVVNLPWLVDWFDSWWLRAALPSASGLLTHRTLGTLWNAPLWGCETDRMLSGVLLLAATVGVVILNQTRERAAARMIGVSSAGSLVLAMLGISWEPLGVVGTAALLAPALWFACIPAAHAWIWTAQRLWQRGAVGHCLLAGLLVSAGGYVAIQSNAPCNLCERCRAIELLEIGLGRDREAIVRTLLQHTTTEARILWEDRTCTRQSSRWPALLPLLTGRSYIGGLDPDGFIEHSSISLRNQALEGAPIAACTDEALTEYCRRCNVRWIVAWSPAVIERLEAWKAAEKVEPVVDGATGWLFQVRRTPSYALKGQAELVHADGQSIMFANVVPIQGEVVLSLHWQAGLRASLDRVQLERAVSSDDQIGFIRLKLAAPAACLTLTWER